MGTEIHILHGNQIGGCMVLIGTDQTKICIDYGENLPGCGEMEEDREAIDWEREHVDAVFFTHSHGDHVGRFMEIPEGVPLYMGKTTRKIMTNIQGTLHREEAVNILSDRERIREITAGKPVTVGNIRVTPYMVDHSAYDAYMFLIETPDQTILHTGDFRNHGYRGKALLPMIKKYITRYGRRRIDTLIIEGTMMSRQAETLYSEARMAADARNLFADHKYVFLICSSTNLDTLATFYQAAAHCHRGTYANHYVYSQLKTFSETAGMKTELYHFKYVHEIKFHKRLPKVDMTQEEYMRENGFLVIIKAEKRYEEWIKRFEDLNPIVIYSMWNGYIDPKQKACKKEMQEFVEKYRAIPMHTSGHAPTQVLAEVIEEIDPKVKIIPIHTECAGGFQDLRIRPELKSKIRKGN